jgi:hypothetical protein
MPLCSVSCSAFSASPWRCSKRVWWFPSDAFSCSRRSPGPHHLRAPVREVLADDLLQHVEALDELGAELAAELALLGLGFAEAPLEQRAGIAVTRVLALVEGAEVLFQGVVAGPIELLLLLVAGLCAHPIFLEMAQERRLPPREPGHERHQEDETTQDQWAEGSDELGVGRHGAALCRLWTDPAGNSIHLVVGPASEEGVRRGYFTSGTSARTPAAACASPWRAARWYQLNACA